LYAAIQVLPHAFPTVHILQQRASVTTASVEAHTARAAWSRTASETSTEEALV
jgi:hypothetical protein